MTKIRLQRVGKKGQPEYRIVVTDDRKKLSSDPIENLGSYNPNTNPFSIKFDIKRVEYWLSIGAKPSETVRKLLKLNAGSRSARPRY